MARICCEPIEVRQRDTVPDQFLWRGRLYAVRDVHAHWMAGGEWWRRPDGGLDDADREYWRVEAGSAAGTGVYDICFDPIRGEWAVVRVHD
jgi:hypothetical protein